MATVQKAKTRRVPHIRWMIRRDVPYVLAIEGQCFRYPWDEDKFIRMLRQRNCIGMVAERDEEIVGYMIYELNRTNLEIMNFAVHPKYQRDGIGAAMIDKLIGKLSPQRRNRIKAMVWERNIGGQLFMQTMKFQATCVVKDHYEDVEDAAYLFEYVHKDQF